MQSKVLSDKLTLLHVAFRLFCYVFTYTAGALLKRNSYFLDRSLYTLKRKLVIAISLRLANDTLQDLESTKTTFFPKKIKF